MTTTAPPPSHAVRERSWPDRLPLGLLAIVSALTVLLFVAQPLLAGQLMTGDVDARLLHQRIGTEGLGSATLFQVVAAVLAFRPRPGRRWPLVASAVLLGTVFLQSASGFEGHVALHVPLGVAMVGLQVWLTTAVLRAWKHAA